MTVVVDDEVTDGKRIAQLLASECTGLETGPLADVTVEEAETEAEPTPDGTKAYTLCSEGRTIAVVLMYPASVDIRFTDPCSVSEPRDQPTTADRSEDSIVVSSGAEVKRAVDAVRSLLDRLDSVDRNE